MKVKSLLGETLMEPVPAKQEEMLRFADRLLNRPKVRRLNRRKIAAGALGRSAIDERRVQLEEAQSDNFTVSPNRRGVLRSLLN